MNVSEAVKYRRSVRVFDDKKVNSILSKCLDQDELEAMSVLDFQELFTVEENSF